MADTKISGLSAFSAFATGDLLVGVDVSDTTMAATGTDKKLTLAQLNAYLESVIAAITVANEASDTTCFPLFVTAATGALGPKTNAGLTFNSATGMLTPKIATIKGATDTTVLTLTEVGAGTSYLDISNGNSGSPTLYLAAIGAEADISIDVNPKGSGTVLLNGVSVSFATTFTTSAHTLTTNGVTYTLPGVTASLAPLTSPTFVTPVLGAATGTSIALGGATIGSNALAVTGTALINGSQDIRLSSGTHLQLSTAAGTARIRLASFSGNDAYLSLDSNTAVIQCGASTDTYLTRSATAGIWNVGTSSSNAAGGLSLTTLFIAQRTPASAGAAGVANTICFDADFIYICTATNTWKRVAIATW